MRPRPEDAPAAATTDGLTDRQTDRQTRQVVKEEPTDKVDWSGEMTVLMALGAEAELALLGSSGERADSRSMESGEMFAVFVDLHLPALELVQLLADGGLVGRR